MGLSGEKPLREADTKATNSDYRNNEPPAASRHAEVARGYLKRLRGLMSSAAFRRAPTGLWPPRSRRTTGVGCWSS